MVFYCDADAKLIERTKKYVHELNISDRAISTVDLFQNT